MPQLDWTTYPSQLFWLLLIFFPFWGVLHYIALRPFQDIFRKRQETLESILKNAEATQEKAARLERESQEKFQLIRLTCEQSLQEHLLNLHTTLKNNKKEAALATQLYLKEIDQKMTSLKHEVFEDSQLLLPELEKILLENLQKTYSVEKP